MSVLISLSPSELAGIIQGLGFRARVERNDPEIATVVSAAAGRSFVAIMVGADKSGKFRSIQLWAGFEVDTREADTLNMVNKWNKEYRFTKAYLHENQLVHLELDLIITGLSKELLEGYIELWADALSEF